MLELPGFESIRDGEVYAAPARAGARRILLAQRWRTPTVDELLEELYAASLVLDRARCEIPVYERYVAELLKERELLRAHLVILPNDVIDDFRARNAGLDQLLRERLELSDPPEHFLEMLYGTLPKKEVAEHSASWYEERLHAIAHPRMGVRWVLKLVLDDHLRFPPSQKVISALRHHRENDCVLVTPEEADFFEVADVLKKVYAASSGDAERFADCSVRAWQQLGCDVVQELPRLIKRNLLRSQGRDRYSLLGENDAVVPAPSKYMM